MDAAAARAALQAALADHQAGRRAAAEAGYRRILAAHPRHPDALHMLGVLAHETGRSALAAELIGQALAITPDHAPCHSNLGNALLALGRLEDAEASFRRAPVLDPAFLAALSNLGNALLAQGRYPEAMACYQRALSLRPDFAEAHCNLGYALIRQGQAAQAVASLRRALELRPDFPEALNNLGMALESAGEPAAAIASLRRALELRPDYAEAHNNLGNALKALGETEAAIASYRRALDLHADYVEAHTNLGQALEAAGRVDDAIASYRRARDLRPDFAPAYWNEALALLLKGDFVAGWKLFEWRFRAVGSHRLVRSFPQPAWRGGTPLAGHRILIHYEQGFGDTLQMLRYVPVLARQGAQVVVEVPAAMATLAATLPGGATVVPEGAPLPPFDLQCPLMSLPMALGTTVASVPAEVPYLAAPEPERSAWARQLGPRRRRRIGLAWSGSAGHTSAMRQRSLPVADLAPLLAVDAEFHSLQKEYRGDDLARIGAGMPIRDHAAALVDFAATAGLLAQMDLVISVDTAVAHLAGAMGLPVWVLLPFVPDYRWMRERSDSPWYPTMRLFRQPAFGAWQPVIAAVLAALAETG
jgi:tetratricopeptide (TPR) repeat protein